MRHSRRARMEMATALALMLGAMAYHGVASLYGSLVRCDGYVVSFPKSDTVSLRRFHLSDRREIDRDRVTPFLH
jgi:hypothetical protein